MSTPTPDQRLFRAYHSLQGLCCGDAFGERFFLPPGIAVSRMQSRALPAPPWFFTDDTAMAVSVVSVLERHGCIHQDDLAAQFASSFHSEPNRGYGLAMHELLPKIRRGADWRTAAAALFDGQGSFGNGSAMRVAPLGAYFADDLDAVVEQAQLSSAITHAHSEATAGAVAIAVAAALAFQHRDSPLPPADFLGGIDEHVPESHVRAGVERAIKLPPDTPVELAANVLGSGSKVSAPDTVPFVLWCAAHHLDNYEEAMWTTVRGFGDIDTNCAMVGGIIAAARGISAIPTSWLEACEPLPRALLKNCALLQTNH